MTKEPTLVHTCQVGAHTVEVWTHLDVSLFDARKCGALKGFLFQVKVDGKAVEFPNIAYQEDWYRLSDCETGKDKTVTVSAFGRSGETLMITCASGADPCKYTYLDKLQ